jgi:hypothetical protein
MCPRGQEFLGFSSARTRTIRALRFTEVSTLNPLDIEHVLDIHIGLRRRLHRYGKLKKDLDKMATSEDGAVNELEMERMKERIEGQFHDSEESELRGTRFRHTRCHTLQLPLADCVGVASAL